MGANLDLDPLSKILKFHHSEKLEILGRVES